MLVLIGHVRAEPLPQPKLGQCPSGYRESEGSCAPLNEVLAAFKKAHAKPQK